MRKRAYKVGNIVYIRDSAKNKGHSPKQNPPRRDRVWSQSAWVESFTRCTIRKPPWLVALLLLWHHTWMDKEAETLPAGKQNGPQGPGKRLRSTSLHKQRCTCKVSQCFSLLFPPWCYGRACHASHAGAKEQNQTCSSQSQQTLHLSLRKRLKVWRQRLWEEGL